MRMFSKLFGSGEAISIYAPMEGEALPLSEVPDPTFSGGVMGEGVAIRPTNGKVYAPFDGVADMVADTGHALMLVSDYGTELLIHVGLETVALEGKPFKSHIKSGESIKRGQLLLEADLQAILDAGLNPITPVVICSGDDYTVETLTGCAVTRADAVLRLRKKS